MISTDRNLSSAWPRQFRVSSHRLTVSLRSFQYKIPRTARDRNESIRHYGYTLDTTDQGPCYSTLRSFEMRLPLLLRYGVAGADDADVVVGEKGMGLGDLIARHVAGSAIA